MSSTIVRRAILGLTFLLGNSEKLSAQVSAGNCVAPQPDLAVVIQRCVHPISVAISDPQHPGGAATYRIESCGFGLAPSFYEADTDVAQLGDRYVDSVFVSSGAAGYSLKLQLQNGTEHITYVDDQIPADGASRKLLAKSAHSPELSVAISPRKQTEFAVSIRAENAAIRNVLAALISSQGVTVDGIKLLQSARLDSFLFQDLPIATLLELMHGTRGDFVLRQLGEKHFSFSVPAHWQEFRTLAAKLSTELGHDIPTAGDRDAHARRPPADPKNLAELWEQMLAFLEPNDLLAYGEEMIVAAHERALMAELQGDLMQGEHYYRLVLAMREHEYSVNNLRLQGALLDLAAVLQSRKKEDEARLLVARASQSYKTSSRVGSFDEVLVALRIAELEFALGIRSMPLVPGGPELATSGDRAASETATLIYASAKHLRSGSLDAASTAQKRALHLYRSQSKSQRSRALMDYGYKIAANQLALCTAQYHVQLTINETEAKAQTIASCPNALPNCLPMLPKRTEFDFDCLTNFYELLRGVSINFQVEHGYPFPPSEAK